MGERRREGGGGSRTAITVQEDRGAGWFATRALWTRPRLGRRESRADLDRRSGRTFCAFRVVGGGCEEEEEEEGAAASPGLPRSVLGLPEPPLPGFEVRGSGGPAAAAAAAATSVAAAEIYT